MEALARHILVVLRRKAHEISVLVLRSLTEDQLNTGHRPWVQWYRA